MGFIWTFIMTSLLTTNAFAILNEKRFLRRIGLHQVDNSDGPPSIKNQVAGLLTAVQYTRVLLIPINIVAIGLELLLG
ncbi:hypothetical protein H310_10787 [Aphanomyces invadans]|uniref:Yos1-like protein n=1 Tax=Aphanomyces invadans TaxID=157072 RepID=A0A024TPT1_9STRA|nr:hypothetical protein H310_10787 [Aphanomyces invadans]ETV96155.1 hypothetical protein H310_10787 [Aphanomyces invadans]|eukprot:XP_008875466.1 hypothetical protein H310_10787 [Aphanomyces invadans]